VTGDGKTEQQNKKNTMKTKNQNNQSGLGNPEQLNNNNTAVANLSRRRVSPKSVEGGSEAKTQAPNAQTQTTGQSGKDKDNQGGKGNLPPIDAEKRKANRTLPLPKVLNLLHAQLPAAYRLAEVVGKWVWVTFKEQPAAEKATKGTEENETFGTVARIGLRKPERVGTRGPRVRAVAPARPMRYLGPVHRSAMGRLSYRPRRLCQD